MSQDNVLDIPRFATEEEEATWWDSNPDFLLQELEQAKAEGRLGQGTVKQYVEAVKDVALRLDAADVALANRLAERKGLEREAYLRELLHAALLKEAESLDQSSAA